MQLWTLWLDVLRDSLQLLSSGLGLGLAIVTLTLLVRFALLPVSWSCAYRGCVHRKRLQKLQPELQRLRELYKDEPGVLAERSMSLYKKRGVALLDLRPILGSLAQTPVLLGMYQILRSGLEGARFLWVASLARPDAWLAVCAGVATAIMMAANPDLPEQTRWFMIVLPSILAIVFALKFSSALAIYWVVSNSVTALQTAAVHLVVDRRIRSGALKI